MTAGRHCDSSARRVAVIGAGAAGLFAAAEAAERGAQVDLLEKNSKTGVKILMSGGTRCNLTQDTDARGIISAFGRNGRFLQKSVGRFGPVDVVALFQQLGVPTKVESTGKVFPKSNRAIHVRDALEQRATAAGVKIHRRTPVIGIQPSASDEQRRWTVQTDSAPISYDCVIVTAGGKSWPGCGTTGDAYAWLQALGHSITRTHPALVPLVGGARWTRELSGLTIDDCVAAVYETNHWRSSPPSKRNPLINRRGSWLFTHQGFSGPAAMDVSGTITQAKRFADMTLVVDFLPSLSNSQLEAELGNRKLHGKTATSNLISRWLPQRLSTAITENVNANCSIAQLKRTQLQQVLQQIKTMQLDVTGTRGFEKAEVTAGGVKLSEVDPQTMESRLCPGLFIAGEVLDLDGWIGGYNFQAAFSTGRAAGIAASGTLG